jgi:hypothetical protein
VAAILLSAPTLDPERQTSMPGWALVKVLLSYQVCTTEFCLPMQMLELDATLEASGATAGKSSS